MKYLLDTHILLWIMIGDKRLKSKIISVLEEPSNIFFLSNASLWEIAIKVSIGKLRLAGNLIDLKNYLVANNISILQYDFEDLEILKSLPFIHQDPFDRLLVAQAKSKSIEILTNDTNIKQYFEQAASR